MNRKVRIGVLGGGHGGSDFYSVYHFAEKLPGNPEADTIGVYEAMDMFLPGMFAYRSIPAASTGDPEVDDSVYDRIRQKWERRHGEQMRKPEEPGQKP